jgi:HPt (histidine-containing phosphotransfer) domain-containing protein
MAHDNPLLGELQEQHGIQFVQTPEEALPGHRFVCLRVPAQLSDWLPWYDKGLLACLPSDEADELLPYLAVLLENPPCERLYPDNVPEFWLRPDFRALDALSGGQLDLRNRMLYLYEQMRAEELPKLEDAIAQNRWPDFAQSVHRLKSNFRSLGMQAMQHWCEDLELAARLRACLPGLSVGARLFCQTLKENLRTF